MSVRDVTFDKDTATSRTGSRHEQALPPYVVAFRGKH